MKANQAPEGGTTYEHANPGYNPKHDFLTIVRPRGLVKQSVFKSSADKAAEEEAMREAGTCPRCQGRGEVFSWAGVRKDCECVVR